MKQFTFYAILLSFLIVCSDLSALTSRESPIVTNFAGGLLPIDGTQAITQDIGRPGSVITGTAGDFYFANADNRIYRVAADGVMTAIAGNGANGFSGDGGPATGAQLFNPTSFAMDAAGNLFIADSGNNRVRKVTPDGVIVTVAGTGEAGFSGDGGPAVSARFNNPNGIAVDSAGNVFISDSLNYRVRKITPAGIVSTVAGNG